MLAEYLEKKLEQYKIATKLADRAWEKLIAVEQTGGKLVLGNNEKEILKKIGVMDDVEGINKSLGQLEQLKLADLITSLQSIRLPDDEKAKAIDALVKSLQLIKKELSTQTDRLTLENQNIRNNLSVTSTRNKITLRNPSGEGDDDDSIL